MSDSPPLIPPDLGAKTTGLDLKVPLRPDQIANLKALAAARPPGTLRAYLTHLIDTAILDAMPSALKAAPLFQPSASPPSNQWVYHYANVTQQEALQALAKAWNLTSPTATIERALLTCLEAVRNSPEAMAEAAKAKAELLAAPPVEPPPRLECQAGVVEDDIGFEHVCTRRAMYRSKDGRVWCREHYGPGDVAL